MGIVKAVISSQHSPAASLELEGKIASGWHVRIMCYREAGVGRSPPPEFVQARAGRWARLSQDGPQQAVS